MIFLFFELIGTFHSLIMTQIPINIVFKTMNLVSLQPQIDLWYLESKDPLCVQI